MKNTEMKATAEAWAAPELVNLFHAIIDRLPPLEAKPVELDEGAGLAIWPHHAAAAYKATLEKLNSMPEPAPAETITDRSDYRVPLAAHQIDYMVNRFLSWKLPETFSPDGGIKFDKAWGRNWATNDPVRGPIGTNLFSAVEAKEMIEHMLTDLPTPTAPVEPAPAEPDAAKERMDAKCADMLACIRCGVWKEADYVKVSTALLRAILEDREAEPAPAEPDTTTQATVQKIRDVFNNIPDGSISASVKPAEPNFTDELYEIIRAYGGTSSLAPAVAEVRRIYQMGVEAGRMGR